jgi:hypothetical protein
MYFSRKLYGGVVIAAALVALAAPNAEAAPAGQSHQGISGAALGRSVMPASSADPKCSHPCTSKPDKGWVYQDYFFFHSDCDNEGRRGKEVSLWRDYQCLGGDTWTDYDLWVLK